MDRVPIRNIGDIRIQLEHLAELPDFGAGTLFDQLALLGDGADPPAQFRRKPEGRGQIRVRVGIDGQDSASIRRPQPRQRAGHGRFAHPAFA